LSVVNPFHFAPTATRGRRRLRPVATLLTVPRNACGLTSVFLWFSLFFATPYSGASA